MLINFQLNGIMFTVYIYETLCIYEISLVIQFMLTHEVFIVKRFSNTLIVKQRK